MLSALNGELSYIVLEPVNNSTDYEHYSHTINISAGCKSTVRITSLARRGRTLAYHVILLMHIT